MSARKHHDLPRTPRRMERIAQVLRSRQPDLSVVVENIHDSHNVSAILRSCDAVGVHRVELVYTSERFPDIGKKSSSSAQKWIERRNHPSIADCYAALRGEGFLICATYAGERSVSLFDIDFTGKIAVVLGNEHRGVSEEAAALADSRVWIPMVGMIESLNVSVAAAVCLYEAFRQRLRAGCYERPCLTADQLSVLEKSWVCR